MLSDFITRLLVLVLGYAYPAFECYKTVEKNRVEIEQLRFWCQYWIIIALLTVTERFGDVFISWLPMYGEMKLAFVVYLWHPKTKGTNYVYQTFLRPYVAKHETDIDRQLMELRARAWDLIISYWQNCAAYGQTTFFQVLQFLAAQSARVNHNPVDQKVKAQSPSPPTPPPMASATIQKKPPSPSSSMKLSRSISPPVANATTIQKKLSSPSSSSMKLRRSISQEPKANTVVMQEHLSKETIAEAIVITEATTTTTTIQEEEQNSRQDSSPTKLQESSSMDETLRSAMSRLRRSSSRPHE